MRADFSQQHILIVDDKPTNLKVLAKTLTSAGFDIAVATNGTTAIQMIEDDPPELILLDILMPEMDGFDTYQRIKANPLIAEIPVIFMSALSDTNDKIKGLSLGAVDYITKPFETQEVLARVKIHLEMRFLTKTLEEKNQELSQALQRLNESQEKLIAQEKLAVIGTLTTGIVHELRNPLNFIKNYAEGSIELSEDLQAEIEQQYSNLDSEAIQYIGELIADLHENSRTITHHALRAENVIQDMLMQTRTDQTQPQLTNLNSLLDKALLLVHKSKIGKITVVIDKDYDDTIDEIMLISDQISRTFINIIDNAFYALHSKQEQCLAEKLDFVAHLSLKTKKLDGYIEIRILDNGVGITPEIREKIFHPFFSTKPTTKGTGLGLSLSYDIIVNNHNGSLKIDSEVDQYTEVTINLPLKKLLSSAIEHR